MAASRVNYVAIYEGVSQVYSSSSLETIATTPKPKGAISEATIMFITYQPDSKELCLFPVPEDEIETAKQSAEEKKTKKSTKNVEAD